MRGRPPSGPEYVEHLEGSETAKERVKVILQTMAGTCRVQEACQRLGICEQRFEQLRQQILQAALERLEPRPLGRPPRTTTPANARIGELEKEIASLKTQLQLSQTRTEIALVLPNIAQEQRELLRNGVRSGQRTGKKNALTAPAVNLGTSTAPRTTTWTVCGNSATCKVRPSLPWHGAAQVLLANPSAGSKATYARASLSW